MKNHSNALTVRKTRRLWLTIFIPLLVIVLGISEAWDLRSLHLARQIYGDDPNLSATPRSLLQTSVIPLNGIRLKQFGFSFQIPWTERDFDRPSTSVDVFHFRGGGTVFVYNPYTQIVPVMMPCIGASKSVSTNYERMSAELQATPSALHWWSPLRNARTMDLLSLKSFEFKTVEGEMLRGGVYVQQSGELRGYQLGDPAVSPYSVDLKLYDHEDRLYRVSIAGSQENHQIITQSQINAIVASLQPIQ